MKSNLPTKKNYANNRIEKYKDMLFHMDKELLPWDDKMRVNASFSDISRHSPPRNFLYRISFCVLYVEIYFNRFVNTWCVNLFNFIRYTEQVCVRVCVYCD